MKSYSDPTGLAGGVQHGAVGAGVVAGAAGDGERRVGAVVEEGASPARNGALYLQVPSARPFAGWPSSVNLRPLAPAGRLARLSCAAGGLCCLPREARRGPGSLMLPCAQRGQGRIPPRLPLKPQGG